MVKNNYSRYRDVNKNKIILQRVWTEDPYLNKPRTIRSADQILKFLLKKNY